LASYRKNADGDLLVTLWPSNRNEGLPRIWRHDGVGEYPAPKEESALLETVAKDAVSDVESFQDNGASPPLSLVYDCSRILQAEASVGNLVAALRTCGLAREKLLKRSFCDSAKDSCGNASTDPIIRMLDRRLEDAKKTDIYRRLASEQFKVSTPPATK
jgi:hypothetical protein